MAAPVSSLKRWVYWAVVASVSLLVLMFSIDNRDAVTISLFPLPYEMETRKFLLIILCFAAGLLCGRMLGTLSIMKTKREMRHQKDRLKAYEQEAEARKVEQQAASTVLLPG